MALFEQKVSDAKHLMRDGLSHNSVSSVRLAIQTAAAIRYVVAKWLMELPHRPSSGMSRLSTSPRNVYLKEAAD
jgi:hypothetical protein